MKITPLAGSNIAGVNLNSQGATPDRREAAKQAFLGNSQHTVTPADNYVDPLIQAQQQNVRKIRVNTNATPGRLDPEELAAVEPPQAAVDPSQDPQVERIAASKPISPQFAELQRQKRALAKEREAFSQQKASLEQSKSTNSIDLAKIKESPLKVLKDAGVTYEQLTEAVLAESSGSFDPDSLKAQLLEDTRKTLQTEFTQRDAAAEQQVLKEIRRETDQLVATSPEFKGIKQTNKHKTVVDLIEKVYRTEGHVMDTYEAAKLVEKEVREDARRYASILEDEQQAQQAPPIRQPQFRTLTNRQTATAPMSPRARALAAFNGTLKR